MSVLVYIHGTNGSGKSTLARAVLASAGGPTGVHRLPMCKQASWTRTGAPTVVLVGKYSNACGGVDGIQPYARVGDVLHVLAHEDAAVFAEGLVTPGVDTCCDYAAKFDRAVFVLLDTPPHRCILNVLRRRKAAGNAKAYSPANLYKKMVSARSWADRIERAGLEVHRLQYPEAHRMCLSLLNL